MSLRGAHPYYYTTIEAHATILTFTRIRDFGLTDDETQIGWYAGLITTTFSLAQVMSSIPIGLLSDRIGRRPVLLLGLAGNVVSACMFGLSKSFAGAVVSRAMLGLVNGENPTAIVTESVVQYS